MHWRQPLTFPGLRAPSKFRREFESGCFGIFRGCEANSWWLRLDLRKSWAECYRRTFRWTRLDFPRLYRLLQLSRRACLRLRYSSCSKDQWGRHLICLRWWRGRECLQPMSQSRSLWEVWSIRCFLSESFPASSWWLGWRPRSWLPSLLHLGRPGSGDILQARNIFYSPAQWSNTWRCWGSALTGQMTCMVAWSNCTFLWATQASCHWDLERHLWRKLLLLQTACIKQ